MEWLGTMDWKALLLLNSVSSRSSSMTGASTAGKLGLLTCLLLVYSSLS